MSNPFLSQQAIPGIKHIVAVGSGKGGVGKSTISLNLALGLSKLGLKAGVLDADVYGPSLPRLTGTTDLKPELDRKANKLIPIRRYGLNLMSMGNLIEEESPLIWRGPMLFKAMEQFFREVDWGELDVLLIDLPPGTGDVALTMAQKVPVSGGVVVSTAQNLSLVDAQKAVNMFLKLSIPLIGLVENMSYYKVPGGDKVDLFPRGQIDSYIREKHLKKIALVPFNPLIGLSCEAGVPFLESEPESEEGKAIFLLAEEVKHYLLNFKKEQGRKAQAT